MSSRRHEVQTILKAFSFLFIAKKENVIDKTRVYLTPRIRRITYDLSHWREISNVMFPSSARSLRIL